MIDPGWGNHLEMLEFPHVWLPEGSHFTMERTHSIMFHHYNRRKRDRSPQFHFSNVCFIYGVLFLRELWFFRLLFFLNFCFPASLLLCFLLLMLFFLYLLLCFSTVLLLCFLLFCFSSFPCFSASLPLCFFTVLLLCCFLLFCFSSQTKPQNAQYKYTLNQP